MSLCSTFLVDAAMPAVARSEPSGHRAEVVVVLRPGADAAAVAREHAEVFGAEPRGVYRHALSGYAASVPASAFAGVLRDPRVAYLERDREISLRAAAADPLEASTQVVPTGVDRVQADQSAVAAIDGVDKRVDLDVAVIDTGIDLQHPDLNVVASIDCTQAACEGTGDDDNGHGTHVAGTVAALDNGFGVVGVAPGARLHGLKILDSEGSGSLSGELAAFDWIAARAATIEVANMSFGASGYVQAERDAIAVLVAKGVVMVAAAGNDSMDVYGHDHTFGGPCLESLEELECDPFGLDDVTPAAYPEVMAISALADSDGRPGGTGGDMGFIYPTNPCLEGDDDSFACFSNYSTNVAEGSPVTSPGGAIDLMLPGVAIASTWRLDDPDPDLAGYSVEHGTSMAAPHAAGLAALYISANRRAAGAAGVYAIRQALVDAGWAQDSAEGLAFDDDPDPNPEPLGSALGLSRRPVGDFSGDGTSDAAVFRPSNGIWYLKTRTGESATAWGTSRDIPVPADYDGEGRADIAVFRPSDGTWYVKASTAGESATPWGTSGDIPVPADYDGDGRADIAVFRPSQGAWFLDATTAGKSTTAYGAAGDVPVPADYDGDGRADIAVFRPSSGTWYVTATSAGESSTSYGTSGDVPVPGHYDADDEADMAVFRPSQGTWYVKATTAGESATPWGTPGDVPVPAHYDADAYADLTVFRPSQGTWFLDATTAGRSATTFGTSGDIPVPAPPAVRVAMAAGT